MTVNNIARNMMSDSMMRVASGKRVNSAADDAAGLAIAQNMETQIRGLDQGERNTNDMQNMVQTAEGGLDTISDSLNRIRELSVQGLNNGIYNESQRAMIREEIGQLADGIKAAVNGVEFNTQNLLDGTVNNANTASSPDGTGAVFSINDMSSIAQAMTAIAEDGSFDLEKIDAAISQVAEERANLGSMSNRMDFTANANSISSLNLVDSRSRIADADMAKEMMAVEQEKILNEAQVMLQRNAQEQEEEEKTHILQTGV
ncbi:MAG: flagellin [Clostridiales bacterium]|jgi:flagellin|nr:flagellin [Clostridiales bacterium]